MKNFSVKSGFGIGAVIFAVAAIIALPLRLIQYFTVIEGGTGFYTENSFIVYLLYAVVSAAVIALVVIGLAKTKKLDYAREAEKRPLFGIFSLIAAAGVFADGIKCITQFMNDEQDIIIYSYLEPPVINTEKILYGCEAVFAALSAIFLLALGLAAIRGKTNGSEFKLISLSPVIWLIFRLVFRFTRTISYLRVSELTYEMLMLMFMLMFFMSFAQVNSQIGAKNCEWKLASYGLSASLLALLCFVPRFILTVFGKEEMLYSYSPAEFCDLAAALFMIAAVFTRLTDRAPAPEISEEETEPVNASVEE